MLYDLYMKKIQRRYYIQRLIIKNKVLIICISSLISLLLLTYLSIKGMVYDVNYTKHVPYGDNFNISAKGLFSDVTYEFSVHNQGEWVSTVPTTPGRYEVKIISSKSFNRTAEKRYEFTIYPKEVNLTIVNDEVEFGKNPEISLDLIDGDTITNLSFIYDNPSLKNTTVTNFDITITNSNGDDVTKYYNINFEKTEVTFVPREITIELLDQEKVYDGTPLESIQHKTEGLIEGHRVEIEAKGSQTEAGDSENSIDKVTIFDQENNDVTQNYSIKKKSGNLIVNRRKIVVKPDDQHKVYDGTPLTSDSIGDPVSGSLVDGHTIVYEIAGTQLNVGTSDSKIVSYNIFDGNKDVTDNYEITYLTGILSVQPRQITIDIRDKEKVYDGNNEFILDNDDYDVDIDLNSYYINLIVYSENPDVGIWGVIDHDIEIFDSTGGDVTENFDITINGQLTIAKRSITVIIAEDSKVYDGHDRFEPTFKFGDGDGLATGHEIYLSTTSENPNVGTWDITGHTIYIYEGSQEVTGNYDIETIYNGKMTVSPRPIKVIIEDANKVYDGNNRFQPNYHINGGYGIVDGHLVYLSTYSEDRNVGVWDTVDYEMVILDGNENVNHNYEIVEVVKGRLTITRRPIAVIFDNATKVYDGDNIFTPELLPDHFVDLVDGHTINQAYVYASGSNVGSWEAISHTIRINDGLEDVTNNYDIKFMNGDLTITKRNIKIQVKDAIKIYDGNNVFQPDYELIGSLVSSHRLNLLVYSESNIVGGWETADHKIKIFDGSELVTENYDIEIELGKLTITKRPITVVFDGASKVYDGNNRFTPSFTLENSEDLVADHVLSDVAYVYSLNGNVGTWGASSFDITIYNGIEDVTENYDITAIYGELTITPRPINVVIGDLSKVYDGSNLFELDDQNYEIGGDYQLVANQIINYMAVYSQDHNVGTWAYLKHEIQIYDGEQDVTDNYEIEVECGQLTIEKRKINVIFDDATKIYDGNNIFKPGYHVENLVEGHKIHDAIVYSEKSNVGTPAVANHYVTIYNGTEDVTHNYEIIPQYGELTITKRSIYIQIEGQSKVYDGNNKFYPDYSLVDMNDLADGHSINSVIVYTVGSNWGDKKNVSNVDVKIYHEDLDVSDNYEIILELGTYSINKRNIKLVIGDTTKIYDGSTVFNIVNHRFIDGAFLANDETIQLLVYSSSSEIGIWDIIDHKIVINRNDIEVTDNYSMEIMYDGQLTIKNRPITISHDKISKKYDGTNRFIIEEYQFEYGSLPDHLRLEIIAYTKNPVADVYEIDNVYVIKIYDGDKDVTDNFEIHMIKNSLTIEKRPITIKFDSASKVYDGTKIFTPNYEILTNGYGLLPDHIIGELYIEMKDSNWGENKDPNRVVFSIFDSENNNVSKNYVIIPVYGTYTIQKRTIPVVLENATKPYDGTSVFEPGFKGYNLVPGQELQKVYVYTVDSNWGENKTPSRIKVVIMDDTTDVSENYEVIPTYGTYTIQKRSLEVVINDISKIYDGTTVFNIDSHSLQFQNNTTLAENEKIFITVYSSNLNVGIWGTEKHDIEILNVHKQPVTDNYDIEINYGQLTITKRPISLDIDTATKIYDGHALFNPEFRLIEGSLAKDHIISIQVYSEGSTVEVWKAVDCSIQIYIGDEDVTHNYEITHNDIYHKEYTLTIVPRPIIVNLDDISKIYDGTNIFEPNYAIDEQDDNKLISGHTISQFIAYTLDSNYGDKKVPTGVEVLIVDEDNNDVSCNYKIIPVYGTFNIKKRPITIILGDATKVYDGTNTFEPNYDVDKVNGYELVLGQEIKQVIVKTKDSNYGDKKVPTGVEVLIVDEDNIDVSRNYEITPDYGTYTIKKKPITINLGDATKVYDGTDKFEPNYEVVNELVPGQEITQVIVKTKDSNWGENKTPNKVEIMIQDSNQEDVSKNYDITLIYGTYTIKKRSLTIEFENSTKIYDGTDEFEPKFTPFGLVPGQKIGDHVYVYSSNTNVGTWQSVGYKLSIYAGNDNVTDNYDITPVYKELTITKRPVTIIVNNTSKIYDGNEIFEIDHDNYHLIKGILDGHDLTLKAYSEDENVGVWNAIKYEYEIFEDSIDVTDNYDLNVYFKNLIISKKPISIMSGSDKKIYDGTELTNNSYKFEEDDLVAGHRLIVDVTGSIIEVGIEDNVFSVQIVDQFNNDITGNYEIIKEFGTLEILVPENGHQDNKGNNITDKGFDENQIGKKELFKVYSDINRMIYLRERSFGDYSFGDPTKVNWEMPPLYQGSFNPLEIPGRILEQLGYSSHELKFRALTNNLAYYMPYYSIDGYNGSLNDTAISKSYGLEYSINYIPYIYNQNIQLIEEYQLLLADYERFVKENYLTIPESTRNEMLKLAEMNDLDPNSLTIIEDVQNYIRTAATYNMEFPQYPADGDFAVLFLTDIKEGICQHFATAATMMYRALGIPARYTIGYVVNAKAGEWVSVTPKYYHAWVEVYISGFGWVPIEVTAGGANGDFGYVEDNLEQNDKEVRGPKVEEFNNQKELPKIEIISRDAHKKYDGQPLSKDEYFIFGDINPNHEIIIENLTEITTIGRVRNKFTTMIIDKETGEDVTHLYEIRQVYGDLVIVPNDDRPVIELKPFTSKKVYDGKEFTLSGYDFWIPSFNLPEGFTVELEFDSNIIEVGYQEVIIKPESIKIYDEYGQDVTGQFTIIAYSDVLEVVKRDIEITTLSAEKIYDEKAFTHHAYSISKGSLAEGHVINITWPDQSYIDVGIYPNKFEKIVILDENGKDVTENYNITKVFGELKIVEPERM